ncbi:MAG: hypothetical protein ACKO9F_21785 [Caldilinea sp.]|jgi:hypothetical protein
MKNDRKRLLTWWLVLVVCWVLAGGSVMMWTSDAQEKVFALHLFLSDLLWDWRMVVVFLSTLVFFPEFVAAPFRLPADTFFASDWIFPINTVARVYYVVFSVGAGTAISGFWLKDLTMVHFFAPLVTVEWLSPLMLGGTGALAFFVAFHFHDLLNRRDSTIWILIAFLATLQMLLLGRIDFSVPAFFVLAVAMLPTTTLLPSQLREDSLPRRKRILTAIFLFCMSTAMGMAMYSLSMPQWQWLSIFLAAVLFCLALSLAVICSREQGYLHRLYQRHRLRKFIPLRFNPIFYQQGSLGEFPPLRTVVVTLVRIGLTIANVMGEIFVVLANGLLLSFLIVLVVLIRVPEIIGASTFRLRYALGFYLNVLVLPILAFTSAGLGIALAVVVLTRYLLSGASGVGFLFLTVLFMIFLSIFLGYSSLYRLSVSTVSSTYFMTEARDAVADRTPITYFAYALILFWVVKSFGMVITLFTLHDLAPLFKPGFFFGTASLLMSVGMVFVWLPILRKR